MHQRVTSSCKEIMRDQEANRGPSLSRLLVLFERGILREGFGMLLQVRNIFRIRSLCLIGLLCAALLCAVTVSPSQAPSQNQQPVPGTAPPAGPSAPSPPVGVAGSLASPFGAQAQQTGLNIVVLDPAHGGTDPGARGTGGIRESEIVLDFA